MRLVGEEIKEFELREFLGATMAVCCNIWVLRLLKNHAVDHYLLKFNKILLNPVST
jgi:hypothetical protein